MASYVMTWDWGRRCSLSASWQGIIIIGESSMRYEVSGLNLTCVCPCIIIIWKKENQTDATQCFIELVIWSTRFGHVYARHQELATVLLVWPVAHNS